MARKPAAQKRSKGRPAARSSRGPGRPPGSRSRARRTAPARPLITLSPERKLDLIGAVLALVGLLTLLSLVSASRGGLMGAWIGFLNQAAGWGSFALPLALILVGAWLVLRKIDRLPIPSAGRIAGVVLFYLGLLAALHLLGGGGWELASRGAGGGFLGAAFERLLTGALGKPAAVVLVAAWLLVGLVMLLDVSVPDLLHAIDRRSRPQPASRTAAPRTLPPDPSTAEQLPRDFQPLDVPPAKAPARSGRAAVGPAASTAARTAAPSAPKEDAPEAAAPAPGAAAPRPATPWVLPAIEAVLDPPTRQALQASTDLDRGKLIEKTLASFGAPAHVVEVHRGPTVTQFGVEPDFIETRNGRTRVRVSKIVSLADDLALALAAHRIRIQAPVPGRNYVGIEVPNAEVSRVTLREVIESEAFRRQRSNLRFALGKNVSGEVIAADLAAMPHLLIAGTTGSGKSVCVNSLLCSFLMNNTPDDLRLVLVDPKRVELTGYNGVPHLLAPVVVDTGRVIGALQWMQREMDSRYHKFSAAGVRNIGEYNNRQPAERLPQLVVVIDELADLMMLAPDETQSSITRLAQLARATGIHLILATQRPSVDVITGLIKANFPARIAFTVASGIDSRVILDQPGAERLLGRGDMLFQAPDASSPVRLQGAFVSDHEIQRLVDYWRDAAASLAIADAAPAGDEMGELPRGVPLKQVPIWEDVETVQGDPLLNEAIDLVRREGRASITMLQRRMRIGYTRAARLVDAMEEKGIISPPIPNSQVREVLDYGPAAPPPEDA